MGTAPEKHKFVGPFFFWCSIGLHVGVRLILHGQSQLDPWNGEALIVRRSLRIVSCITN